MINEWKLNSLLLSVDSVSLSVCKREHKLTAERNVIPPPATCSVCSSPASHHLVNAPQQIPLLIGQVGSRSQSYLLCQWRLCECSASVRPPSTSHHLPGALFILCTHPVSFNYHSSQRHVSPLIAAKPDSKENLHIRFHLNETPKYPLLPPPVSVILILIVCTNTADRLFAILNITLWPCKS